MSAPLGIAAELPWNWFDFGEMPRPVRPGQNFPPVEAGGAEQAWRIIIGGRVVPFKLLRRAPEGAKDRGQRPLLVMLHGMGLTIATFHGVARYLFQTHDLALIDYSTLSSTAWREPDGWPSGGVAIKAMAEAVWAVADAIGVHRMDLAGNSLGGALCLLAAIQKPERVRRMVLANPACYPQRLPLMYRLAKIPLLGEFLMATTRPEKLIGGLEHIGYVDKTQFEPELRGRYLHTMTGRRNRFRLMEMIRHLPHGPRDMTLAVHVQRLRQVKQPVMLTWGGRDPLLVEGAGERLASDLPNCVFVRHGDLAHMPHEEAPQIVGKEWAAFLKSE